MITSHQNRIEELRESFKQKLYEADQFPQKVTVKIFHSIHPIITIWRQTKWDVGLVVKENYGLG